MKKIFSGIAVVAFMLSASGGLAASLRMAGFSAPVGVLQLPDGAFLVSEWSANRVTRADAASRAPVISGISSPAGIAADNEGNIYIAGYGDGNIYVWRGAGQPEIFAGGFRQPTGLLWTKANTLLVANRGAGTIEEIDKQGNKRIVSRGHALPVGVALTESGNMYVSCYGGTLDRVSKNGAIRKIGNGFGAPGVGILAAGADSVFVVDNAAGRVVEAGPHGVSRILADNLAFPVGLAKTADNVIVAATWGDGKIQSVELKNE